MRWPLNGQPQETAVKGNRSIPSKTDCFWKAGYGSFFVAVIQFLFLILFFLSAFSTGGKKGKSSLKSLMPIIVIIKNFHFTKSFVMLLSYWV